MSSAIQETSLVAVTPDFCTLSGPVWLESVLGICNQVNGFFGLLFVFYPPMAFTGEVWQGLFGAAPVWHGQELWLLCRDGEDHDVLRT